MATGRTVAKWTRIYASGYPICNMTRTIEGLKWEYPEIDLTTMCDSANGYLPGIPGISTGTINGVMDNTATTGLHILAATPNAWNLMIPIGIRAAPAEGDPVFMCRGRQLAYTAEDSGGAVVVNLPMTNWDATDLPAYALPWGVLLHEYAAETGANAGTGVDGLGSTSTGGYMMYQVFAGNGNATISVDDSANNADWLACAGLTTGNIDCSSPTSGIIELGTTATIRQYTRWQLALDTATTVTFALAIVRGR